MKTPEGFYYWAMIVLVLAALLLTGADNILQKQVGRYRISLANRGNFTDIYIVDTATGVVKYVGKDEGKPFDQISGK